MDDEGPARRAHGAFAGTGMTFLHHFDPSMDFSQWLRTIDDIRDGGPLPPDSVRAAFLAADVDGQLVGRVSVRFELNAFLASVGGHIGYAVIVEHRRRGYATRMLALALGEARAHAIDPVLLVCDDDNVASATVIERCGGVLESVVVDDERRLRRYWIHHPD
jgi:predicted acetyltransferase